jgi:hypothetical protein
VQTALDAAQDFQAGRGDGEGRGADLLAAGRAGEQPQVYELAQGLGRVAADRVQRGVRPGQRASVAQGGESVVGPLPQAVLCQ